MGAGMKIEKLLRSNRVFIFFKLFLCLLLSMPEVKATPLQKCRSLTKKYITNFAMAFAVATSVPTTHSLAHAAVTNDVAGLERFQDVRNDLVELDREWDAIAIKGGDEVRRKLGTVYGGEKGCGVSLCGFRQFQERFITSHFDELDFDELEEPAKELIDALNQADFLAYSSNFAEYGNGGGRASEYIDMSHTQVQKALKSLDTVISLLNK